MPGLALIGNKRRLSDIEDNISDEDEQDQARFVYYYNSNSSEVSPCLALNRPFFAIAMTDLFIRNLSASSGHEDLRVYRMVTVPKSKDPNMKILSLYFKPYTHYLLSFFLSSGYVLPFTLKTKHP